MHPTADRTSELAPPPEAGASGKLVIIGILTIAVVAAATSWWFRYFTTHQAVDFWGPQAALLIRDAPRVDFFRLEPDDSTIPEEARIPLKSGKTIKGWGDRIVSNAHGMSHLRNALLEDRSFTWPARVPASDPQWRWMLVFQNVTPRANQSQSGFLERIKHTIGDGHAGAFWVLILFTEDCTQATMVESADGKVLSCEPIAAGLAEMFAEFATTPAAESAAPAR